MKISTKITLSLIGWLFLFQFTSAQTINRNAWNLGLTSGIAHMGDSESHDADGYYHVSFNIGYFPAADLAFGLEFNYSNITLDNGPYPAIGIGPFFRVYSTKNFYLQVSYEAGVVVYDELVDYNKFTINLGYSLFLNKSFALEPKIFYVFHNESGNDWDFNGPGIGLGIQSFINRH
jgi:hypothetical protein